MIKFKLKHILIDKKMTQIHLAKVTGIRQPTISAICLGRAKALPISVVDRICAALDCQPGDIIEFCRDEPKEKEGE